MMQNWAIVPVKPFVRAKSRLAAVLSVEQRKALAEKMFRHSIEVLADQRPIAGVSVLSRDAQAMTIARQYGARTIQESGTPSLNESLCRASAIVRLEGWDGLLVLPADLPLVTPEDIRQICHAGRYLMTAVIAPDRHEDDTNALLVRPASLFPFSFGPGSFQRHIDLARKAGATVFIYRSEQVGLDIDTPADLDLYRTVVGDEAYQAMIGEQPVQEAKRELIA
ncbi:MAG: 2-phospho-L-lactate guanylyltransferase [Anaerolineae bacterium]|nr:2-phospho-L-lactate guanylyltransferase [Anaerolineae bacterium]